MMKLICYLLAFYTITLSCLPCQDEISVPLEFGSEVVASSDDHTNESTLDLCSPFCICACCAAVTLPATVPHLPETNSGSVSETCTFAYKNDFADDDLSNIWQPPKHLA
jgi:hypothetical protein